jgi:hypothetical protein
VKVKKTSSKNFDMVEEKGGHTGHGLEVVWLMIKIVF